MRFRDRFTEEQRKTKYFKILREYYISGWILGISGLLGMIAFDYLIIRAQLWRHSEAYIIGIVWFITPFAPLISGIYLIKYLPKKIRESDWEYIYNTEKEAGKKNPWRKRR